MDTGAVVNSGTLAFVDGPTISGNVSNTVGATLVFAVAALGAFLGTALIPKVDKPNDI